MINLLYWWLHIENQILKYSVFYYFLLTSCTWNPQKPFHFNIFKFLFYFKWIFTCKKMTINKTTWSIYGSKWTLLECGILSMNPLTHTQEPWTHANLYFVSRLIRKSCYTQISITTKIFSFLQFCVIEILEKFQQNYSKS